MSDNKSPHYIEGIGWRYETEHRQTRLAKIIENIGFSGYFKKNNKLTFSATVKSA